MGEEAGHFGALQMAELDHNLAKKSQQIQTILLSSSIA